MASPTPELPHDTVLVNRLRPRAQRQFAAFDAALVALSALAQAWVGAISFAFLGVAILLIDVLLRRIGLPKSQPYLRISASS